MVKLKHKILAVLLTAAMVMSMSSVVAWSDEMPVTDDTVQTETTDDANGDNEEADDDSDDKGSATVLTTEQGLAKMKKYAENSDFILYLNEDDTTYAVQSKDDDYVWWSAPLNMASDPIAKPAQRLNMLSPFYIYYGDIKTHNSQKMSAYEGSIEAKDFKISKIDNGVRIDYHIAKIDATIPMTIVLEKDNVNVSILSEEIVEPPVTETSGECILSIAISQFFGAAGLAAAGSVIPSTAAASKTPCSAQSFMFGPKNKLRINVPGLEKDVRVLVVGDTHFNLHDERDDEYKDLYKRMSRGPSPVKPFAETLAFAKKSKIGLANRNQTVYICSAR